MKKTILLLLMLFPAIMWAQYQGSGYYRVTNYSSGRYIWVVDYTGGIVGTSADSHAIQLHAGFENSVSNPQSIIYISDKGGGYFDLKAQGTGIYKILGQYVQINVKDASRGICLVEATKAGLQFSLGDTNTDRGFGYTELTIYGQSTNNRWVVTPVSSSSENYFGIKPTFTIGGKYYAPFFTEFAYRFASEGMKAFKISKVDNDMKVGVIEEIEEDVIPACTPVLIECSSENASENRIELLDQNISAISDNLLQGNYHCYDELADYSKSPLSLVKFDEKNMRVFNVKNGKLVLSTDKSLLYKNRFLKNSEDRFLRANSSYFLTSGNNVPTEFTLITPEEYGKLKEEFEKQQKVREDLTAYAKLSTQVTALTSKLDNAVSQINQLYPQASAETKADVSAIKSMIKALQNDLDKKHANVQLTASSTIDTLPVERAISNLLDKAKQIQNEYNQKVSANKNLYNQFCDIIEAARSELANANEHITTECPLVAENYKGDIEQLQSQIDALQSDLEEQYKLLALTEESSYDTSDILAQITNLIADANEAQEIASCVEFTDETGKETTIYTLSGVRVEPSKVKRGVYVVNGKLCIF